MAAKPTAEPQPYPYQIPPIEYLKEREINNLDPWDVQEFFRIEALLRSKTVANLYKQTFETQKSRITLGNLELYVDYLERDYKVHWGWRTLKGGHHNLILWSETRRRYFTRHQPYEDSGIFNLKGELARGISQREGKKRFWRILKDGLHSDNPQSLYLKIDASYPTRRILDSLRIIIEKQKVVIKETPEDSPWFPLIKSKARQVKKENLRKFNFKAWLNYFHCYDLYQEGGKSFGEIGLKLFPIPKKIKNAESNSAIGRGQEAADKGRDSAEKAHERVEKLIWYAETKNWPPPANYLNKKLPSFSPL